MCENCYPDSMTDPLAPSPENRAHWRAQGELFGYPKCCIDWFCTAWTSLAWAAAHGNEQAHALREAYFAQVATDYGVTNPSELDHIPCPACLTQKQRKKSETLLKT